jgi:hypothetical protein
MYDCGVVDGGAALHMSRQSVGVGGFIFDSVHATLVVEKMSGGLRKKNEIEVFLHLGLL